MRNERSNLECGMRNAEWAQQFGIRNAECGMGCAMWKAELWRCFDFAQHDILFVIPSCAEGSQSL